MFSWFTRTQRAKIQISKQRKKESIEFKSHVASRILETHQTDIELDERRKMARRMTLDRRVYGH